MAWGMMEFGIEIYAYEPIAVISKYYRICINWRMEKCINTLERMKCIISFWNSGTNVETVKRFVKENADEIVDYHYDEHGIYQMDLSQLLKMN